ncbi:heme exporter protein CcmB [Silanimonas sp.]|uniref:heme exporter protein CcmB n=1 Tax=Silanimonas sp. TaxID=1929290 RepID=UPI001BC3A59C|nr:heme exporter protein CcmB [Silanimonas sp.]MBS3896336.1 heme exporter protein CcmB [Silanimonas sp.]MBS3923657.1 heme exporter protein CcmB [Xanthomonadaceae bacterium]
MSAPSYLRIAAAQLRRDLALVWARRGDALQPVLFAVMVASLFPLALGAEPGKLAPLAAGIVWVCVLLAGVLGLDALYRSDAEDGGLEQMLLSPAPLALLVAVRVLVHWLTTALPVILIAPLLAEMLALDRALLPVLMISLLLGSPLLSLVGAVIAALTVGLRRSGMLLPLLVMPLYVPVLVFGAGSVAAAAQGLDHGGALLLLAGGGILALVFAPLAAAAALRIVHS